MTKVVYYNNYGGFKLPLVAIKRYLDQKGISYEIKTNEFGDEYAELDNGHEFGGWSIDRHDPDLVEIIEDLHAIGEAENLSITEIDSDRYIIEEYDGLETVVTPEDLEDRWIYI